MGTAEEKMYYSIGEVAGMFKVQESTLRYWEKEFPLISPRKSPGVPGITVKRISGT